jgi:hypothetical protein
MAYVIFIFNMSGGLQGVERTGQDSGWRTNRKTKKNPPTAVAEGGWFTAQGYQAPSQT